MNLCNQTFVPLCYSRYAVGQQIFLHGKIEFNEVFARNDHSHFQCWIQTGYYSSVQWCVTV